MPARTSIFVAALAAAATVGAGAGAASAAEPAPYDPHTVIVKYRDGVDAVGRQALDARAGVRASVRRLGGIGAELVRVDRDPAKVSAALERSADVEYAEPNYIGTIDAQQRLVPSDPQFP